MLTLLVIQNDFKDHSICNKYKPAKVRVVFCVLTKDLKLLTGQEHNRPHNVPQRALSHSADQACLNQNVPLLQHM
jgi:hypothetical protein